MRVANAAITFATSALIARSAGADVFGRYSVLISMASLLAATVGWGTPNYLSRELPRGVESKTISLMLLRAALISVALGVLASIAIVAIQTVVQPDGDRTYQLLGLAIGVIAGASLCIDGAIRGLGGVLRGQFAELLFRPLTLMALLVLVAPIWGNTLWAFSLLTVACYLAAVVFSLTILLLMLRPYQFVGPNIGPGRAQMGQVAVIGVSAWLDTAITQVPLLMIGWLADFHEAATFRLIFYVVPVYALALRSFALEDYYLYARAHAAGDDEAARQIQRRSSRMTLLYFIAATVPLILIGPKLLSASVDGAVQIDFSAFAILCIGICVTGGFGTINMRLLASGRERQLVATQLLGLLVSVILGLVLIPIAPVHGAVIAYVVGYGASKLAMAIILRRSLQHHGPAAEANSIPPEPDENL